MPLLQILTPGLICSQRLSCFQGRREGRSTCFSRCRDQAWDRRAPAASLFGRSQDFSTEPASPTVNHQEAAVGASASAGLQADLVVCQDPGSTEEPGQVHKLPSFLSCPVLPSLKESLLWTGFLCLLGARRPQGTSH